MLLQKNAPFFSWRLEFWPIISFQFTKPYEQLPIEMTTQSLTSLTELIAWRFHIQIDQICELIVNAALSYDTFISVEGLTS